MVKKYLFVMFFWVLVSRLACAEEGNAVATVNNQIAPPNIIFILADDLGYGDLSSYGAKQISTPHVDSLAKRGVRFTDSYSISPICSPARAGLLTGRYPARMGIRDVFFPQSLTGLPENEVTLAEMLQQAGYRTHLLGKWHLGHRAQYMPMNHGFDYFYGYLYSNDMHPFYTFENNKTIVEETDQSNITADLTKRATQIIRNAASVAENQPYFLFLSHPMPHIPLAASESFKVSSRQGLYEQVIRELDWSVGEVMRELDHQGQLDNSIVIFASDNGPWLLMEEEGGSTGGLRGGKGNTFEGGMRVPTIVSWPNGFSGGRVHSRPTTLMDWFPTIAEITNQALPDVPIDGRSLLKELIGTESSTVDKPFVYFANGEIEAIRSGDWKLKYPPSKPLPWLMRIFLEGENDVPSDLALYNLREDMYETNDLAPQYPEIVTRLQAEIEALSTSLSPLPHAMDVGFSAKLPPALAPLLKNAGLAIVCLMLLVLCLTALIFYRLGRGRRG